MKVPTKGQQAKDAEAAKQNRDTSSLKVHRPNHVDDQASKPD